MTRRSGVTLLELLVVVALIGVLAMAASGRVSRLAAQWGVRQATRAAIGAFTRARLEAQVSGQRTAVVIAPPYDILVVRQGDTLSHLSTAALRVALEGSRDSMAYVGSGLAWGASNLSLVLRRGDAADTVFVSRLGRVR
ncbi:MAG: prepilin-type N-terminal cleavage/methylation domain-containing protein [Gemmatimonadaceae bacterium]|jgi:prepilin-type N-terminal cleavage/methylation domain-containing protein|nr:prepilin-type N-terminal cleavage/methylation domain-containing protein [Gemmatimonadaceae bacterium]